MDNLWVWMAVSVVAVLVWMAIGRIFSPSRRVCGGSKPVTLNDPSTYPRETWVPPVEPGYVDLEPPGAGAVGALFDACGHSTGEWEVVNCQVPTESLPTAAEPKPKRKRAAKKPTAKKTAPKRKSQK